ncbi:MAG: hypothetical protein IPP54_08410 [Anaerolineales bacterium]|nr:hypothetical protein [Anaerolineales bacterium]
MRIISASPFIGASSEAVNKQTSLWRTSRQEIKEEQYKEFYRQTTLDFEDALLHTHRCARATVCAFVHSRKSRTWNFAPRKEDGLKLCSRNILIDDYNKDLLPEYLPSCKAWWTRRTCRSMSPAKLFSQVD